MISTSLVTLLLGALLPPLGPRSPRHECAARPCLAVRMEQAVDVPPSAGETMRPMRRGNGRGSGGGRGRVLVLRNPQYAVKLAPPPAPPPPERFQRDSSPPRFQQDSAPPTRVPAFGRNMDAPPATDGLSIPVDDGPPSSDDSRDRGRPRRLKQKAGATRASNDDNGERKPKRGRRGKGNAFENEATMRSPRPMKKKGRNDKRPTPPVEPKGPVRLKLLGPITVGELAEQLGVGAAAVVKDLMKMGVLASITQSIDVETAATIAEGFGAEVSTGGSEETEDTLEATLPGVVEEEDDTASLQPRPPIVTVMGHVDHGKTSLLDALRSTEDANVDVVSGEAGGITQHIGAYQLTTETGNVTVLDTPGHAAFSQMRGRGANVTDIVILVVAADDGVKEQTVTSINAAKAAGVPIIVAINKIDKPEANPDVVKQGLLQHEVVLEDFGGDTLSVAVSAKTGQGLDELLEQVLLQASLLELRANPERLAQGVVLEARNAQGQGAVATTLVQKGTLRTGDVVVAGSQWGRVRALLDERGDRVDEARPSAAVELVGLGGLPAAGDVFTVTTDESAARHIAEVRQQLERERKASSLFAARTTEGRELFLHGKKDDELPLRVIDIVVKADVQGSAQALSQAISELEAADDKLQVRTRILREGAGEITSEDVMLASVSSAQIVGFNVKASKQTSDEAAKLNINIKEYSVVYDVLDDISAFMASLIRPPPSKQLGSIVGTADVLQTFKIGAVGKVAGLSVRDGYVRVGCNIRILRGNLITYEGRLQSLRSGKDEVEQVDAGNECGVSFLDFQAMLPDDRVEVYLPKGTGEDGTDDSD